MDKRNQAASRPTNYIDYLILGASMVLMLFRFLNYPTVLPDEAIRYNDIRKYSYSELLHLGRLGSNVHDPYGFLVAIKLLTPVLPAHEYALRLYPFICAILSIWLFAGIKDWFSPGIGGRIALCLLVFSPLVNYHANHLMPYTSDMLVTILLLYLFKALYESDLSSKKEQLRAALWGSLAVWFSLPSVFMLGSVVFTLGLETFLKKDMLKLRRLLYIFSAWLFSFCIYYFYSVSCFTLKTNLLNRWADGLWPSSSSADEALVWLARHFYQMFSLPAGIFPWLGIILFSWGLRAAWRSSRLQAWILILPFILMLVGAYLQKYPFEGRLLIFLLPLLFILVGRGLEDFCAREQKTQVPVISAIVLFCLFFQPLSQTRGSAWGSASAKGFEPVTAHILRNFKEGDGIYVLAPGNAVFSIYKRRFGVPEQICISSTCRREKATCVEDFSRFRKFRRIWFVMYTYQQNIISSARQIGSPVDEFRSAWSYCCLIELDKGKLESYLAGN